MAKNKNTIFTILLICEGENTEPFFFDSIRDEIINKTYDIGDVKIKILPEPRFRLEKNDNQKSSTKNKRKQRKLKVVDVEPVEIRGEPPLKWVLAGQEELKNGTYDEVWVIFDHDNHPTRKEAFEIAENTINGKKVNIAFSSRSFEYYLLLHFERKYFHFEKSECKTKGKNSKKINCGSNLINTDDCKGSKCINGYARVNNFWNDSKDKNSTFNLIKDKLLIGFENSAWLRNKSNINEKNFPEYDRNPYITIDYLVKRLTGNNDYYWIWIDLNKVEKFDKFSICIFDSKKLIFTNLEKSSFIFNKNSFCVVDTKGNRRSFGDRKIIDGNQEVIFDISSNCNADKSWYILSIEKFKIMFDFDYK